MNEVAEEFIWYSMILMIPITVYLNPFYTRMVVKTFPVLEKVDDPAKLYKIVIKTLCIFYFGGAFVLSCIGFLSDTTQLQYLWKGNLEDIWLSYSQDKLLKFGLCLVASIYATDLYWAHQWLKWPTYAHHSASIVAFLMVFPDADVFYFALYLNNNFFSRYYAAWFGLLLTSRFVLYVASLYYYVGPSHQYKIRLILYLIGGLFHILFMVGQFGLSVYLRKAKFEEESLNLNMMNDIISLAFLICFQLCVLPSQFLTIYDLYCIIKYKIKPKNIVTNVQKHAQHVHQQATLAEAETGTATMTTQSNVSDDHDGAQKQTQQPETTKSRLRSLSATGSSSHRNEKSPPSSSKDKLPRANTVGETLSNVARLAVQSHLYLSQRFMDIMQDTSADDTEVIDGIHDEYMEYDNVSSKKAPNKPIDDSNITGNHEMQIVYHNVQKE